MRMAAGFQNHFPIRVVLTLIIHLSFIEHVRPGPFPQLHGHSSTSCPHEERNCRLPLSPLSEIVLPWVRDKETTGHQQRPLLYKPAIHEKTTYATQPYEHQLDGE